MEAPRAADRPRRARRHVLRRPEAPVRLGSKGTEPFPCGIGGVGGREKRNARPFPPLGLRPRSGKGPALRFGVAPAALRPKDLDERGAFDEPADSRGGVTGVPQGEKPVTRGIRRHGCKQSASGLWIEEQFGEIGFG